MTLRSLSWAVACAALFAPLHARATVVEGQSFEEMSAGAKVIVRGTVGAQQARWDDGRRRIHTYTEVRVTEALKGQVPTIILVRQPGGEVDGIGARVSGAARFHEGEEVLLFLEAPPDEPDVFVVRALTAGKVTIAKGPVGELRAMRDLRGVAFYERGEPKPVVRDRNEIEDLGNADKFLARIRTAVSRAKSGGTR